MSKSATKRRNRSIILAAAFSAAGLVPAISTSAGTLTWSGSSANWSAAANWDEGVAPGADIDNLTFRRVRPPLFPGPFNLTPSNDLTGLTIAGLDFQSGASAYTVGGNALTLGVQRVGTGIFSVGDITNSTASAQIVSMPITLGVGKHNFVTGSANLNITGAMTQNKGSAVNFARGAGSINVAGTGLANSNGILGGWATIGQDWATLDGGNNVVAYNGYTNVYGGSTLVDNPASNVRIPVSGGAISIPAGVTRINTLQMAGNLAAQTVNIGTGNTLVLGQNGGIFNTTLMAGGSTVRNLNIGATVPLGGTLTAGDGINPANITFQAPPFLNASGQVTVNSAITDNGAAPVSVTLNGGYITLTATNNSYSGGTYILSGRISQPIGSTFGTGPVHIHPGGMINPGGGVNITIANNLFIAGYGTSENNGLGSIRMFQNTNGFTTQLTGTVTLTGDTSICSNNLTPAQIAANRHVAVVGKITGPGGLGIGSPVTNSANGAGVVEIGALSGAATANDYAGDTTINGGAGAGGSSQLRISQPSNNNIMPHGSTGSFSGGATGNLILNATAGTRTAIFDLNGSTQTINGLSNTSTSVPDNFVQSSSTASIGLLRVGDSNASSTFGGGIRDNDGVGLGTVAVTKIGGGTLTLFGGAVHTGPTNIDAGAIAVNGTLTASAISVNTSASSAGALYGGGTVGAVTLAAATGANRAVINPGLSGPNSIATLGTGNVSVGGNSDLQFDGLNASAVDVLNTTGTISFSGAASTISPSMLTAGTYLVVSTTGGFSGTSPTLGAGDTRLTYAFNAASWPLVGAATSIIVDATGSVGNVTWTGSNGATWDLHNTTNWTTGSPDRFFNGDNVTFNDTASPNYNVTVNGNVAPSSMTFSHAGNYTVSGSGTITGSGTLTKSGSGSLTIATRNAFEGGTTLNAGTLYLHNSRALGQLRNTAPLGLTINGGSLGNRSGAAVTLAGNIVQTWNADVVYVGPNDLDMGAGLITSTPIGANRTITVNAGTLTLGGVITDTSGTAGLVKAGFGTLVLSAANAYNGGTTISNGTIRISNFAALGPVSNANGVTIASGGTLDVGGFATANVAGGFGSTNFTITGDGSGVGGGGAIINSGVLSQNNAFQSITLAGNASVGGPGRFDLRGGSPVLNLMSNTLTKTGPGQFSLVGAAVDAGNIVVNQGVLAIEAGSTIQDNNDGRTITVNSNSTLQFLGTSSTLITRPIVLSGSGITINDAGGAATVDSNISLQSNITVNGPTASSFFLNGTIIESGGSRSVNKTGANTLVLAGTNVTYSGATTIVGGGLQLDGIGTIGPVDGSGATTLVKNNSDTFTIGRARMPSVTINGGKLRIAPNSGASGVSVVTTFTNSALLDLTDNKLIVRTPGQTGSWNGVAYDGLTGQIATGKGTGNNWDGATGIITSKSDAIGSNFTSIGVSSGLDVLNHRLGAANVTPTTTLLWAGQTIGVDDSLIMYTYGGDANLDGKLNIDDYTAIDIGIAAQLKGWSNGDFNYDGKINGDDYFTVIDSNIGNQVLGTFFTAGGIGEGGSGVSAVPEPGTMTIVAMGAIGLLTRRRRR